MGIERALTASSGTIGYRLLHRDTRFRRLLIVGAIIARLVIYL